MGDSNSKKFPDKRGGAGLGAGRKPGTGKFGELAFMLRVPVSQRAQLKDFLSACQNKATHRSARSMNQWGQTRL